MFSLPGVILEVMVPRFLDRLLWPCIVGMNRSDGLNENSL